MVVDARITEFGDECSAWFVLDIAHHNTRAFFNEAPHRAFADSAGPTGDDRNLALESPHDLALLCDVLASYVRLVIPAHRYARLGVWANVADGVATNGRRSISSLVTSHLGVTTTSPTG